jgi:hypothetical protein
LESQNWRFDQLIRTKDQNDEANEQQYNGKYHISGFLGKVNTIVLLIGNLSTNFFEVWDRNLLRL